jgi:hypothetical protein
LGSGVKDAAFLPGLTFFTPSNPRPHRCFQMLVQELAQAAAVQLFDAGEANLDQVAVEVLNQFDLIG